MNRVKTNVLSTIAASMLTACAQEPAPERNVDPALGPGGVAVVNGTPIPESLFRLYSLGRLQKNADQLSAEERDALIDDLVRLRLLADEAAARGLLNERTIAAELELQRLQAAARFMAIRHLDENPATETELRAAYEEQLPRISGTQYKARHILLTTATAANAAITELREGASFAQLARERSTGPTAPRGGDLGWFSAESMVEPFAQAVQSMEIGTFTEQPVQTRFGWHVILLEDVREQQPPGLDAVRTEMTDIVEQEKIEDLVGRLRASSQVTMP